ncbi:MFS transporter [Saccharopolyspora sp. K220]|uniref:MFS transporter n=1 Tax=Saccharopolyspora soli TaxID=2926618 RepID=UPI001F5A65EA|nr:MFS transporter [Saccharopolyspora soli]MCI2417079.1 MFS transporter [Saccharopolyspora soli]
MTTALAVASSRRWAALAVLLIGNFLAILDVFVVVVAAPALSRGLGASPGEVQLVLAGYQIAYAAGLTTGGRLGDAHGRRRIFTIGVGLFMVMSALCGLAPSPEVLVLARIGQGLGTALLFPQVFAVVQVLFDDNTRPRAFAVLGCVIALASVLGQLLGGWLIELDLFGLGWRPIFLINLPIGAVALLAAPVLVPESRAPGTRRLDLVGAGLAAGTLFALTTPLLLGQDLGWPLWTIVSLGATPPLAFAFLRHQRSSELRGDAPVAPLSLFTKPHFRRGIGLVLLFYSGLNAFFLTFGVYLQDGRGVDPFGAGMAFVPLAVAFTGASLLAPRLRRRFGDAALALGAALSALGMCVVGVAVLGEPQIGMEIGLLVTGFGEGLFLTPLLSTVLRGVPADSVGAASGLVSTAQQLGGALGVSGFGLLFFTSLATVGHASALAITCAAMAATNALSAILVRRLHRAPTRDPGRNPRQPRHGFTR